MSLRSGKLPSLGSEDEFFDHKGAPRIHGELLMLGFDLSEPTVSRWLRRASRAPDPAKRWLTFLRNHREAIAAMDFFTVPTLTFGILYCFFIIGHDRRRILHHHVTRNPTALLGCPATARNLGIQPGAAALPDLRPRLEVQRRCGFNREGNRGPASAHRIPQSLAEWNCGALGWQRKVRLARSRDCSE